MPPPDRRRPGPAVGNPANGAPADDDWPIARPRPLGLRLLALLGALAFVMLGLSSLAPLLHPGPETPPRWPDQRQEPVS
ncbi:MAG: hypothetical protein RLZZ124_1695 [Cyanobacteriota bacterium]|jgi:hypothetical protein